MEQVTRWFKMNIESFRFLEANYLDIIRIQQSNCTTLSQRGKKYHPWWNMYISLKAHKI